MLSLGEALRAAGVAQGTFDTWSAKGHRVLPAHDGDGPAPQRRFTARHVLALAVFARVARLSDYLDAGVALDALRVGLSLATDHRYGGVMLAVLRSNGSYPDYYAGKASEVGPAITKFGPCRAVVLSLNDIFADCASRARSAGLPFPRSVGAINAQFA